MFDSLVAEAVAKATIIKYDRVATRIMRPEHLVAIMLATGPPRTICELEFLEQGVVNVCSLKTLLRRYRLMRKWNELFKPSREYPHISELIAKKEAHRRKLAALPFEKKIELVLKLNERRRLIKSGEPVQAYRSRSGLAGKVRHWPETYEDQATSVMKKQHNFVVCVNNSGYEASLELFKIYCAIPDEEPESHGYLRVVDEDGEDYWYPKDWFQSIALPPAIEQAILAAQT